MSGPTLTAPFKGERTIKKGGATLTYIPASEVIDRLNACIGVGGWSFECEVVHTDADFVVVKGKLTVGSAIYEQFGGQKINKTREGAPLDLADDYKGGASDALKKAAQMVGVGLYLALQHPPIGVGGAVPSAAATPAGDAPVSLAVERPHSLGGVS